MSNLRKPHQSWVSAPRLCIVRALTELVGLDVNWKLDMGMGVPDSAERHYVLFNGDEPVVQAQVIFQRLSHFDVMMESGDGTFQVHMDLTSPARKSVVWRSGTRDSIAGFTADPEIMTMVNVLGMEVPVFACKGWIATANGRNLAWVPTLDYSYEYVIFQPGGPRLVTMAATFGAHSSITGSAARMMVPPEITAEAARAGIGMPGCMIISPEGAADAELGGLVALGFAVANEQVMMLHHEQPVKEQHPGAISLGF